MNHAKGTGASGARTYVAGRRSEGPKEKKRVPGWSTEEMKEKRNIDIVKDAEEVRVRAGTSSPSTTVRRHSRAEVAPIHHIPQRLLIAVMQVPATWPLVEDNQRSLAIQTCLIYLRYILVASNQQSAA